MMMKKKMRKKRMRTPTTKKMTSLMKMTTTTRTKRLSRRRRKPNLGRQRNRPRLRRRKRPRAPPRHQRKQRRHLRKSRDRPRPPRRSLPEPLLPLLLPRKWKRKRAMSERRAWKCRDDVRCRLISRLECRGGGVFFFPGKLKLRRGNRKDNISWRKKQIGTFHIIPRFIFRLKICK